MIYSMTGFGRVAVEFKQKAILVEIKSLNSKFLDLKIKISQNYRDKELEIRRLLTQAIERGKADVIVEVKTLGDQAGVRINRPVFMAYYRQLEALTTELNMPHGDYLQSLMRLPDVVATSEDELDDEEWQTLQNALADCLQKFSHYRLEEGKATCDDLEQRVTTISHTLRQIPALEDARKIKFRERLANMLENEIPKEAIDQNRFEQELLYYLEKIDISEEKARLAQHCDYFLRELHDRKKVSKGKKLSFISQEMGREINTIGSKANDYGIQYLVVQMKDELEKVKEQLANIL